MTKPIAHAAAGPADPTSETRAAARIRLGWPAVPWPVFLVAGLMFALLMAYSGAYGFHRDEMYFILAGRHPAFGYADQPPLTPLLTAASAALFGVTPTAVRLLPALEMALVVVLTALIARDLGGSRRAQVLAAITTALSGYLVAGHLDDTAEFDFLAWALIAWLLVRLLAGGDRRLWLVLGVATGIGLENKDTLAFLGAGLAVGLLLTRRWDVVRSPWAWAAIGIAVLIWLPNLVWEALNGWPQFALAAHIAQQAADNRATLLPLLWLFTGPFLFPISITGAAWILRSKDASPWRSIGIAALVGIALVYVTGGKGYYAMGIAPVFMAAGAARLDGWLARGRLPARSVKATSFAGAAVLSGALVVYLALPILPLATYAKTSLPKTVTDTAEQVGWPQLTQQVAGVVAALPAGQRAHAMILTGNYGEAGALELLGTNLPPVYSGHNSLWNWGPPPADLTVVVRVGDWTEQDWGPYFSGCHVVATIDNGLGIPNQEQGQHISVCTGLRASWTDIWPNLRHLD
jgi:4-amino-4-deoxy-L-arabinose transferase-like glycosyltransferase